MSQQRRQAVFSIGPSWGALQQQPQQSQPLVVRFSVYSDANGMRQRALPFAHMLGGSGGRTGAPPPPLARMASVPSGSNAGPDDEKFARWLESMAQREIERDMGQDAAVAAAAADGKARHDNAWYQERCAFCADCKTAIDAETGRRGMRCTGCRRWFHARCNPRRTGGNADSSGASVAGLDSDGRFFHCAACEEGHAALRREAARGRRPLSVPSGPTGPLAGLFSWLGFGGGSKSSSSSSAGGTGSTAAAGAPAEEPLTICLIDLGKVKREYRALQRSGTLPARRQRLLEDAGLAPPAPGARRRRRAAIESSDSSEGSEDSSSEEPKEAKGGQRRWRAVDDFVLASEVMARQWPSDQPKDLLDDSFGVLLARGSTPLCVAQINLHAPDHARIQGIVTAPDHRRQGHAATLLTELHGVLAGAGLGRVVAIIAEDNDESRAARDRLLKRRHGYHDLPIEELVELRRELPDYNSTLVGGCTMLVRHLEAPPPPVAAAQPAKSAAGKAPAPTLPGGGGAAEA